ncbi:hypothetical protein [Mesorhizobium sp. M0139]|uniref:hypothetical protein n=1 Tax=Mesorhizobium sp. M0139 TaxID=2956892 RepID=UPI00333ACD39
MTFAYGTWLAIFWWAFTIITALGLLLLQMGAASAVTALGCSGLAFTAFAALMHLMD